MTTNLVLLCLVAFVGPRKCHSREIDSSVLVVRLGVPVFAE